MYKFIKQYSQFLWAIFSAILLTLAFPKWNIIFFTFFALIPLFFSLKTCKSVRDLFLISFLFGIFHFCTLLYWIVYTLITYGYINFILSLFLLFLLSFYLSLYYLGTFYLSFRLKIFSQPNFLKGLFLALTFTGAEYLRAKVLAGFPWGQLGYLLANFPLLLQSADIWGIWGLTLLVVLINYYVFFLLDYCISFRKLFCFLLNNFFFISFLALVVGYGFHSLHKWQNYISKEKNIIKVALLQGNIPQEMKESGQIDYSLKVYKKLSFLALKEKPDLIFLPETALPFYFPYDEEYTFKLINYLNEIQRNFNSQKKAPAVIFGTFRVQFENKEPKVYNSLIVWKGGNFIDFYDKEKLVPFGEYIPFEKYFPFLKYISVVSNILKSGVSKNLKISFKKEDIKIIPLICFESAFSEILQKRLKENPQFIYIATNDAWFDNTSAPYQHFQMAIIRAVEARRYTLQGANTGITGIIDPTGKVIIQSQLEKKEIIYGKIKPLYKIPPFAKYGNILGILGAIILILSVLYFGLKNFINKNFNLRKV